MNNHYANLYMHRQFNRSYHSGFSLHELAITLTIVAVLAAMAAPSMRQFIMNGSISSATNDLLRAYQVARTEAIKRQQNVILCATSAPSLSSATCDVDDFSDGWIVFQDDNKDGEHAAGEEILLTHDAVASGVNVRVNQAGIAGYNGSGSLTVGSSTKTPSAGLVICDSRGVTDGTNSAARALVVSTTGRVHSTRRSDEIFNTAITCP